MFSYYGSKSKIVHLYPFPTHDKIIEPFAGSARYALEYYERDVDLYDLSPYVVAVWDYLINASIHDILKLPDVPSGASIKAFKWLSDAERYLIGFHLCRGKARPRMRGFGLNSWNQDKKRIAQNLYKVKHWTITQKSYEEIPNEPATYFIDPPYQTVVARINHSDGYPCSEMDYDTLAEFVYTRQGQVIVCEGEGADYLPFEPFTPAKANTNNFQTKQMMEMIYVQ